MDESEFPSDFTFGGVEVTSFVFFGEVYSVGDGELVVWWGSHCRCLLGFVWAGLFVLWQIVEAVVNTEHHRPSYVLYHTIVTRASERRKISS